MSIAKHSPELRFKIGNNCSGPHIPYTANAYANSARNILAAEHAILACGWCNQAAVEAGILILHGVKEVKCIIQPPSGGCICKHFVVCSYLCQVNCGWGRCSVFKNNEGKRIISPLISAIPLTFCKKRIVLCLTLFC